MTENHVVQPKGLIQRQTLGAPSIAQRHNMAVQHMLAAAHFARQCWAIEEQGAKDMQSVYRYNCVGAVMTAYASLEVAINEFYHDAIDGNKNLVHALDPEAVTLIKSHWKTVERAETFEKYQWALFCARKAAFDEGAEPYQSADSLRVLRNALTHYVPEWDTDQRRHAKLEARLRAYRYNENPFAAAGNAYFPMKCLGHGCAEWAVEAAIRFVNAFRGYLQLPPLFDLQNDKFQTR